MTWMKLIGTMPFLLTGAISAVNQTGAGENSYLEYGALGLCAVMVLYQCAMISDLRKELSKTVDKYNEAYNKNTESTRQLCDLLQDRPCLMKDHRSKPAT